MDAFEKEMAKKQLETMKAINRNLNYLGRKLEETNKILQKMVPVPLEAVQEKTYGELKAEEIIEKCF